MREKTKGEVVVNELIKTMANTGLKAAQLLNESEGCDGADHMYAMVVALAARVVIDATEGGLPVACIALGKLTEIVQDREDSAQSSDEELSKLMKAMTANTVPN